MSLPARAWVSRHSAWVGAAILLVAYSATLAPGLTLWDAGEFLAAIRSLGVPHPPGTPLFVLAARAWADLLAPVLPFAAAVNLGSAVATAAGCALLAQVMGRHAGKGAVFFATLVAGLGSTVWASATETEVYAWVLLAMGILLRIGDVAGRRWSIRHATLLCFCFGLAVPLHLSALVIGPAAILLAASDAGGSVSLRSAAAGGAAWAVAIAIGTVSWPPLVLAALLWQLAQFDPHAGTVASRGVLLVLLGSSALVAMAVLARHDPAVNQGDPDTWSRFWDVVARRQYDVPGLWPRRAPAWLQVGNLVQYLDWQHAWGWAASVGPALRRTPISVLLGLLAIVGARRHRSLDPRTFRATLVFVLATSIGVIAVLNLRAGPSFGWGVLPDGAMREARERDYFFAPFFAAWGIWTACGAWALLERARARSWIVAAGVVVLWLANVGAASRRDPVRAALAPTLGLAVLEPAPPMAVLLLAGDNDAYASWYQQQVESRRRDVTTIVVPLLPARWYREEIRRRTGLLTGEEVEQWRGLGAVLATLGQRARGEGRPLAVSAALSPEDRDAFGGGSGWSFRGHVFVADGEGLSAALTEVGAAATRTAALVAALGSTGRLDPTEAYVLRLLACPETYLTRQAGRGFRDGALLESICNYR